MDKNNTINYARNYWRHIPTVIFVSYYENDGRECEEVTIPDNTFKSVDDFISYIEKYKYEILSIRKIKGKETIINYSLPPEEDETED